MSASVSSSGGHGVDSLDDAVRLVDDEVLVILRCFTSPSSFNSSVAFLDPFFPAFPSVILLFSTSYLHLTKGSNNSSSHSVAVFGLGIHFLLESGIPIS